MRTIFSTEAWDRGGVMILETDVNGIARVNFKLKCLSSNVDYSLVKLREKTPFNDRMYVFDGEVLTGIERLSFGRVEVSGYFELIRAEKWQR